MVRSYWLTPKEKQDVCNAFAGYITATAKNARRNIDRNRKRQQQHEYLTSELDIHMAAVDQYPSDLHVIENSNGTYIFDSASVYEWLMSLPPSHREAILLHYYDNWTDTKIALHLGVVSRTIRKWRKQSFDYMRTLFEKEPWQNGAVLRDDSGRKKP